MVARIPARREAEVKALGGQLAAQAEELPPGPAKHAVFVGEGGPRGDEGDDVDVAPEPRLQVVGVGFGQEGDREFPAGGAEERRGDEQIAEAPEVPPRGVWVSWLAVRLLGPKGGALDLAALAAVGAGQGKNSYENGFCQYIPPSNRRRRWPRMVAGFSARAHRGARRNSSCLSRRALGPALMFAPVRVKAEVNWPSAAIGTLRSSSRSIHSPSPTSRRRGIEELAVVKDDAPAKEGGAAQGGEMAGPGVVFAGDLHFAVVEVLALGVHHHDIAEEHVNLGVALEETGDGGQGARQVLLVAIQPGQHVAAGPAQAAIEGVVHALVFFDEGFDAPVLGQPTERAVIGAGVLDDVFDLDRLVGDRGDAKLQPGRTAVTRGDDRETHVGMMLRKLRRVERVFGGRREASARAAGARRAGPPCVGSFPKRASGAGEPPARGLRGGWRIGGGGRRFGARPLRRRGGLRGRRLGLGRRRARDRLRPGSRFPIRGAIDHAAHLFEPPVGAAPSAPPPARPPAGRRVSQTQF